MKKGRKPRGNSAMDFCLAASVIGLVVFGATIQPALGVQAGLTGIGILLSLRAAERVRAAPLRRGAKRRVVATEQEARAGFKLLRFAPRAPVAVAEARAEHEVRASVARPRSPA